MNGGQLPTNQLHDINWGVLDHASRALQLMSCNYYLCVCVCVGVYVCVCVCEHVYMCMHVCTCMCECILILCVCVFNNPTEI